MRVYRYRYGIGANRLPPALLPHLEFDIGDYGQLVIDLSPPCPTSTLLLEHDQFALRMAHPDWWDAATGRSGPNVRQGLRKRTQQHRLNLYLDDREIALPVVMHRPLCPGVITAIRVVREPRKGHGKAKSRVEFVIHQDQ